MESQNDKTKIKIGESGYVNKNCWLARDLGYPPSRRCEYCESKFKNCLFEQYLVITLILVGVLLFVSYFFEQNISKSLIVSLFVLVITYGYFFNKSTEKIIIANFKEKKAKIAFKDLNNNLQQKVDEQTKEIKDQKEKIENAYEIEKKANLELKKLDEAKTQFMLITQHHLRTPLSVNMGFLELLTDGRYGKISKKTKVALDELTESTLKEIQIVNELLDVSSYQLGKEMIRLEKDIDMEELFEETLKDLKVQAEKKGIYLNFEKHGSIPKIPADRIKLKLALTNVIDNCVKYTKEGGVTVAIEIKDNKFLIIVKDTGVGLPEKLMEGLFKQTFYRGQEAQKISAIGKGIGLFLSGKIIESHHGKIWVESKGEGKGAIFYIELPLE
jgi:signal transduction histidine kinase